MAQPENGGEPAEGLPYELSRDLRQSRGERRDAMNAANVLQVSVSQQHWAQGVDRNLRRTIEHIRVAWEEGSDVILFPEANLTGYDFPSLLALAPGEAERALEQVQEFTREAKLHVICGTIQRRGGDERFLNIAHVIAPSGEVVHEYAKIQMAGEDEQRYCRPGNKLSLFEIKGFPATMVICRDGRHPELYRLPAMAGARILFQPACSTETVQALWWKREAGRATQAAGPTTSIFHCCANTVGQDYRGKQTSSGGSFIKHPTGLSLAEADWYSEMVITARLDMEQADGRYARASAQQPEFMREHYRRIVEQVRARKDERPE
ncbi:MAG: carbon-nitrogen hydrolase family protein [Armatimonadota bacterium]